MSRKNVAAMPCRIVLDLTTNAVWSRPPVGIVRVECEFAKWALDHLDNVVFAFFDPDARTFRHLSRDIISQLLIQEAIVDVVTLTDPRRKRKHKTDRIPNVIRPYLMWLLQSRRMMLKTLERIRLTTKNARIAALADAAQRMLINHKYPAMIKRDGSRRACFPRDLALGPPVEFRPDDLLVCIGAGWIHSDIERIATLKRNFGFRFALFCHDILPLMSPEYFQEAVVELHRSYCNVAFPTSDLVVFSSPSAEKDTRSYCSGRGIALGRTAICPLGANFHVVAPADRLPADLEPGHYALLVGTIEPRKGHRLIYEIWKDLLRVGIPQRARFKLVFVGCEGWMVDHLMADLRSISARNGSLQVMTDVDDATLTRLYQHSAFCLLPSRYEGFGLPAVEAFSHGKAILASSGGALPEVVRGFSPCLDPEDTSEWRRMLVSWIQDPAARAPYEARIQSSFRHPSWDESAQKFFTLVRNAKGCLASTKDQTN